MDRAVYKDIVVYSLFLVFIWFRQQGLMGNILIGKTDGQDWDAALAVALGGVALVIAYPLLFHVFDTFQQAAGARLVRLYAIARRPGISSAALRSGTVGHVVRFGCGAYPRWRRIRISRCRAGRNYRRCVVSVLIAAIIGVPTLRGGITSAWRPSAVAELVRTDRHQHRLSRRCSGPQRVRTLPRTVPIDPSLNLGTAVLLSVSVGSPDHARHHLVDGETSRMGFTSAHQDRNARAR